MNIELHPLLPHPSSTPPEGLHVSAGLVIGADVTLRFCIEGAVEAVRWPERAPAIRADDLWQTTCGEAFFGHGDGDDYVELNASPSGAYALYAFSDTLVARPHPFGAPPVVRPSSGPGQRIVDVRLPGEALASVTGTDPWRVGLTWVIESLDGRISHYALHHPATRPHFHHAGGRTLVLPRHGVAIA